MENIEVIRSIVRDNVDDLFNDTLASKLLQLGKPIFDKNLIIHTHDQLIKNVFIMEIISRFHGVTCDVLTFVAKTASEKTFDGYVSKAVVYKSNKFFCEIDMDQGNVSDLSTFGDCTHSICNQAPYLFANKHLIVLHRIDRIHINIRNVLSRLMQKYHRTTSFLLTSDNRPFPTCFNACLILNLCVAYPRLLRVSHLFQTSLTQLECEQLMTLARYDLTNFALLCSLKSPLSFIGHLQSYIKSSILELVLASKCSDSMKYADLIRDFVIRIGASCVDPASIGRIIIDLSESMRKDSCRVSEVTCEMQENIIQVNKQIFSLERYMHRVVEIFEN